MRKYRAIVDDGRDYFEVEFYSEYRANSQKNLEDARQELIKKYRYKHAKNWKIIQIYKIDM